MSSWGSQQIKGYTLQELIGVGGFGEVYRAYQAAVDRDVAIKIILPQHANQNEFIRNFETEARIIARLEHPHIVPLFDFWRDPTGAFLVMRWLRGGSLRQEIETSSSLPLIQIASILEQVSSALAIAHRNHIVHRDIKPENILLDEDGNAYLTDFGIASVIGQTQSEDGISGSIRYISPEQLTGQSPTHRMDIYSLGMVLFEMLTGEYAFGTATPSEIIMKHLYSPIPLISDPDIPQEINEVIQKATAKKPDDRYDDIRHMAHDFSGIIAPNTINVSNTWDSDTIELINPYKGLSPFEITDSADFFGRESLITQLVQRLEEDHIYNRFLAVIGPSGSGKSSVVKAGLIPRLWQDGVHSSAQWFYCDMVPGSNPLEHLEAALLSVASSPPSHIREMLASNKAGLLWSADRIMKDNPSELFILIDQFEELFTLVTDEVIRKHFLDLIHTAVTTPNSRVRIVITLRADFTNRPLEYVDFGELVQQRSHLVVPMKLAEIEQAITQPAARVGLTVDSELVAAIISDINSEPGALPLLQYALTTLYELRQGRRLTYLAYQQIGGIRGSLTSRAEQTFEELTDSDKSIARQVFLRLITLGEGTEDTRRRVIRNELSNLIPDKEQLGAILDTFGRIRVLTFDIDPISRIPTVEVAHEALIREWQQLRQWLDDSRSDIRTQRTLAVSVQEWINSQYDTGFLLTGSRLSQFEEWIANTDIALTHQEYDYVQVSTAERDRLMTLEDERKQREAVIARRAQNFRRASIILGVVGILAVVATVIAVIQASDARTQVSEAQGFVSTAQTQVAVVGDTLTPANLTIVAGNQQIETATVAQGEAQISVETASAQVNAAVELAALAQTQVSVVGETLTPIPATLTPAAMLLIFRQQELATADVRIQAASNLAAAAQTQSALIVSTLTPVGATLTAISNQLEAGSTEIAQANASISDIQLTVTPMIQIMTQSFLELDHANMQILNAGHTLTPIAPTLTAAANQIHGGGTEIAHVNALIAEIGSTLTPIAPTLTRVADTLAIGSTQIFEAQLAVTNANQLASTQVSDANHRVAEAQAQVASANETLTPVPQTLTPIALTLVAGERQLSTMQAQVEVANQEAFFSQTQIAYAHATLTPIQSTVVAAQEEALTQSNISLVRRLASAANTLSSDQVDLSLLLSVAGLNMARRMNGPIIEPLNSLLNVLNSNRGSARSTYLSAHTRGILDLVFTPDETKLITGGRDTRVQIWDVHTREVIYTFSGYYSSSKMAVSPDGKFFALWKSAYFPDDIPGIDIFDLSTMTVVKSLSDPQMKMVTGLQFSPDGKRLISASGKMYSDLPEDGLVRIWDVATGSILGIIQSKALPYDAAYSPDGSYIVTAGDVYVNANNVIDESVATAVQIWDARNYSLIENIEEYMGGPFHARSVAFSPNGRFFLIVSADMEFSSIYLLRGKHSSSISYNVQAIRPDFVNHFSNIHPINREVALIQGTNIVRWDLSAQAIIDNPMSGHVAPIGSLAYSPTGRYIASGDDNGQIILWDIGGSDTLNYVIFEPDDNGLYRLSDVSPDGERLAVSAHQASGQSVIFLASDTGKELGEINITLDGDVYFTAENNRLVITGRDPATNQQITRIYDIPTGQQIASISQSGYPDIVVSRQMPILASVDCVEQKIEWWDSITGTYMGSYTLDFQCSPFSPLFFDPNKNELISVGSPPFRYSFDTNEVLAIGSEYPSLGDVWAAAISPDGNWFAIGDSHRNIRLFDAHTLTIVGETLIGHSDAIYGLAFSPDSQILASSDKTGELRFWHIPSGDLLDYKNTFLIPEPDEYGQIMEEFFWRNLFYHTDGRLFMGRSDQVVVTEASIDRWIEIACRIANRNLTQQERERYGIPDDVSACQIIR